jgi:vomeronasal1 receptor
MIQGIRKSVVYLKKMSRGLSVCTRSLFTLVQTVTSPRASEWGRVKLRSA